jgi:anti-sigma factor RsiW
VKLSQGEVFDLMAYADGELDGDAKAKVERMISERPDARRFVEELGALGPIVQKIYEEPAPALSEGIADAVMTRLADEPAPKKSSRPPKLVDLSAERERRIKVGAAIVAAVALAAGVVLTTQRVNDQSHAPIAERRIQGAPQPTPPAPSEPAPAEPAAVAVGGVDVEQVDSPKEVSVFYLPSVGGGNASSVVVWIDDKGATP